MGSPSVFAFGRKLLFSVRTTHCRICRHQLPAAKHSFSSSHELQEALGVASAGVSESKTVTSPWTPNHAHSGHGSGKARTLSHEVGLQQKYGVETGLSRAGEAGPPGPPYSYSSSSSSSSLWEAGRAGGMARPAAKQQGVVTGRGTCTPLRTLSTEAEEAGERLSHTPVMLSETLHLLDPQDGQTVLDLTFGGGGHCREILRRAPGIQLLALDRDPAAFQLAQELAASLRPGQLTPMLGRFSDLTSCLRSVGVEDGTLDCVLLDAGASSLQFDQSQRGFSLARDGPLDMRMDADRVPGQVTAADVVNHLGVEDLALILRRYGEERLARPIAQAILEARYAFGPITRTRQLADIVSSVFEGSYRQDKLQRQSHVATKTFQAMRIFVNDELNELHNGLLLAGRALRPGGRCVVLTFHSLEDRVVKRHFHGIDMDARGSMSLRDQHRNSRVLHDRQAMEAVMVRSWQPLSKKAVLPSLQEVSRNPRARSARLRAAVKV